MAVPSTILPFGWKPEEWHGAPQGTRWRIDKRGIILEGQKKPQLPAVQSVRENPSKCWAHYHQEIRWLSFIFGVSEPLLLATISVESGGNPDATRDEGHDRSYGLCQLLTATAHFIGRRINWPEGDGPFLLPTKYRQDYEQWRSFLREPWTNIALCAALHQFNGERLGLQSDPMLMYAAYNAGGVYVGTDHYRIRNASPALDAFRLVYNEAVDMRVGDG